MTDNIVMSIDDYMQIRQKQTRAIEEELFRLRISEDWQKFIDKTICFPETYSFSFSFFDCIPDNLKYDFAVEAYTHHGNRVPGVRKAIRTLLRYGVPNLPTELKTEEYITVYRGGEEPADKCKYRISWTTDKSVAEKFLNRFNFDHTKHLYMAKIKPSSVIAYTDDRNEKEILQYRKVFDIEEITPTCN